MNRTSNHAETCNDRDWCNFMSPLSISNGECKTQRDNSSLQPWMLKTPQPSLGTTGAALSDFGVLPPCHYLPVIKHSNGKSPKKPSKWRSLGDFICKWSIFQHATFDYQRVRFHTTQAQLRLELIS